MQHVAATCNMVVIRAISRCNLQRNIVTRQVVMLPVLLHLNSVLDMGSSNSHVDKPQFGHSKRAELSDVNINTGARELL